MNTPNSDCSKIIIMAGGISSRMKLSVKNAADKNIGAAADAAAKHKSMILLNSGKPFLNYLLSNINSAGYSEAVIVVSENDKSFENYYSSNYDNLFYNVKISYVSQSIPEGRIKPLGTADAALTVLKNRPEWKNSHFAVCNGDNLYSSNALSLISRCPHRNCMIDYERDGLKFPLEKVIKFAVTIKNDNSYLADIVEKPTDDLLKEIHNRNGRIGVSMNLWKFNFNDVYPYLLRTPLNNQRDEAELPETVRLMVGDNPESVFALPLNEHVPDLTSISDLNDIENFLKTKSQY